MSASVRSSAAASARGGEGALESRRGAKSTRTANTFGSIVEKSAYEEDGDYHDIPWWDTDFLEPPPDERRVGKLAGGEKDRYSPDHPLWPSLAHYAVMAFALRNIVRQLERAMYTGGEKIGDSCVRAMNVKTLRELADTQMAKAKTEASKTLVKRITPNPKTCPEFPDYEPVDHVVSDDDPKRMDVEHVALTGRDALNAMKFREKWQVRAKLRLKRVTEVSWWRTGKPLSLIRSELIRRETRAAAEAKKNGDPPPASVFGTEQEFAALMPVSNDKRDSVRVDLKESIAGEVILMHPEEMEDKYLELIRHELTRLDVHLASIRYHVNLGIDYDARGNIVGKGAVARVCDMCAIS
jgi:hypothetical protein